MTKGKRRLFRVDRFFFVSNSKPDACCGWFVQLRDEVSLGPFLDRAAAKVALGEFLYSGRFNRVEVWGG